MNMLSPPSPPHTLTGAEASGLFGWANNNPSSKNAFYDTEFINRYYANFSEEKRNCIMQRRHLFLPQKMIGAYGTDFINGRLANFSEDKNSCIERTLV